MRPSQQVHHPKCGTENKQAYFFHSGSLVMLTVGISSFYIAYLLSVNYTFINMLVNKYIFVLSSGHFKRFFDNFVLFAT